MAQLTIAELILRLGYNAEQVAAELERSGGSERVLHFRLTTHYSKLCRAAERKDRAEWETRNAAASQLYHAQETALIRERVRAERQQLPLGQRIGKVLAEMTTLQENTRASSYEARVAGDKEQVVPKSLDKPLVDEWADRFSRVVRLAEHDLDVALGRTAGTLKSGKERDEEILSVTRGERPTIAAEIVGWSESGIRKLRQRCGLNPQNGERVEVAA